MAPIELAVVGLAARFAGFADLDEVEAALYDGRCHTQADAAPADVPGGPEPAADLARAGLTDCRTPAGGPIAVLAGGSDADTAGRTATVVAGRLRLSGPVAGRALPELRGGWVEAAADLLGSGAAAQVLLVVTDGAEGAAFVLARAAAASHRPGPAAAPDRPAYAVIEGRPSTPPELGHVELDPGGDGLGWARAALHAVLALRGNFVPGTPADHPVREAATRAGLAARLPVTSRPWLRRSHHTRRAALVTTDTSPPLVFAEPALAQPRTRALVRTAPVTLVAVYAHDTSGLTSILDVLAAQPGTALGRARLGYGVGPEDGLVRLGLVAADTPQLLAEIETCRRAIRSGAAALVTPRGSALTGRPLGARDSVAFMYPGAFSAYPGAGRDAFRLFEPTLARMSASTADPAAAFALDHLYPPFSGRPSARDVAAAERALADRPLEVMAAGMSYAVLFTRVLRDVFGVRPGVAFGYSLGESSMLRALGVWDERDADGRMATLRSSPLFRTRLSGPLDAVREFWTRQPGAGAGWDVLVLLAEPDAVAAALTGRRGVWISIVNSPPEVVVCGDPDECAKLVARLGCEHVRMPHRAALHAPPAETELPEFVRLNRNPTAAVDRPVFLSAARPGPLVLDEETLARTLAEMAVHRLDFPALVERAHAAGARLFVEVGPGAMLGRLVESTLAGREHVAVSVDRRGVDAQTSLVRALSRLHAHHVPLDLSGWRSTGTGAG